MVFQDRSFSQVADEGETNGGETGPKVTVTVTGPDSVPMGTKVTMVATHDAAMWASKWRAWCSGCDAGPEASRSLDLWENKLTIEECVGMPGKQTYECEVSDQSLEKQKGKNFKVVDFLTPDNTSSVLSATKVSTPDPVPGSPPLNATVFLQTMKVTLKCGNLPVGPCADVCAQEWIDVKFVNKANYMEPFKHLQTRIFPELHIHWPPCGNMNVWGHKDWGANYFATAIPRGFSWDWESPTLTDCWMLFFSPAEMVLVARIPLGKPIMKVDHKYRFKGKNCCGDDWKVEVMVKKQLIARMVDGVKVLTWELL